MIYLITFILAFCSIAYELLLAQALSATLGNTLVRYNTTIGLYIMSLGIGVIFYHKHMRQHSTKGLIRTEQCLAVIGGFCPIIVLFTNYVCNSLVQSTDSALLESTLNYIEIILDYGLIFLIGLLSGFELPMLMDIGKKYFSRPTMTVFAIDYFGSTAGALGFALYLLPEYGLFTLALIIGCANAFIALLLCIKLRHDIPLRSFSYLPLTCIITTIIFILGVHGKDIERYIVNAIYL